MAQVLKIKFGDSLRRWTVGTPLDESDLPLTFEQLEATSRELFTIPATAALSFWYTDTDNDLVVLADDQDIYDACIVQRLNPLRLGVKILEGRTPCPAPKKVVDGGNNKKSHPSQAIADGVTQLVQSFAGLLNPKAPTAELLRSVQLGLKELPKAIVSELQAAKQNYSQDVEDPCTGKSEDKCSRSQGECHTGRRDVFHRGIQCDNCGMCPIIGTRFRSIKTFNYDLCSGCFEQIGNKDEYEKLDHPRLGFVHPVCPARTRAGLGRPGPIHKSLADAGSGQAKGAEFGGRFVKGPNSQAIHFGVECDGCGMFPIEGVRYKFKDRNYDLCSWCYAENGNEIDYEKIEQPLHKWHGFYHPPCPARRPRGPYMECVPPFSRGQYGWKPRCPFRPLAFDWEVSSKLDAKFVKDVTISDGTQLAPHATFKKTWRLKNVGVVPWPQGTQLVFIQGDRLSAEFPVVLELPDYGLPCGHEIDVSIDLTVPGQAGQYASFWQLMTPAGTKFGHQIWVAIRVSSSEDESSLCIQEQGSPKKGSETTIPVSACEDNGTSDFSGVLPKEGTKLQDEEEGGEVASIECLSNPPEIIESSLLSEAKEVQNSAEVEKPTLVEVENSTSAELDSLNESSALVAEPLKTAYAKAVDETFDSSPGLDALNDEVDGFSFVERPVEKQVGYNVTHQTVVESNKLPLPKEHPLTEEFLSQGFMSEKFSKPINQNLEVVLQSLEAMGFCNPNLNVFLLEKNNHDLQLTLDDLLVVGDRFDGLLKDLHEMGFSDMHTNVRLLIKNNGNIKRVVRDLVEMEKLKGGERN